MGNVGNVKVLKAKKAKRWGGSCEPNGYMQSLTSSYNMVDAVGYQKGNVHY